MSSPWVRLLELLKLEVRLGYSMVNIILGRRYSESTSLITFILVLFCIQCDCLEISLKGWLHTPIGQSLNPQVQTTPSAAFSFQLDQLQQVGDLELSLLSMKLYQIVFLKLSMKLLVRLCSFLQRSCWLTGSQTSIWLSSNFYVAAAQFRSDSFQQPSLSSIQQPSLSSTKANFSSSLDSLVVVADEKVACYDSSWMISRSIQFLSSSQVVLDSEGSLWFSHWRLSFSISLFLACSSLLQPIIAQLIISFNWMTSLRIFCCICLLFQSYKCSAVFSFDCRWASAVSLFIQSCVLSIMCCLKVSKDWGRRVSCWRRAWSCYLGLGGGQRKEEASSQMICESLEGVRFITFSLQSDSQSYQAE